VQGEEYIRKEKEARWYEYSDYGVGDLKLVRKSDGTYSLSITTVGPTGHLCSMGVTGVTFIAGSATVRPTGPEKCVFSIEEQANKSLLIQFQGGSCRSYCGMNAGFEGKYKLVDKKP